MDLKSTYNRIARDWFKDHSDDTWWIEGTEEFLKRLEPNSTILDIGCGAGHKTRYLMAKGHLVVGVDFSEEMIAIACENTQDGLFQVVDIRKPFCYAVRFDAVFAQAVLLHISKEELPLVLRNMLVPLRKGGHLYIAVKQIRPGQPEEEVVTENDYGYHYERFFSYYTLEEMRGYLERESIQIVYQTVSFSGKTHWIQIIAQKQH